MNTNYYNYRNHTMCSSKKKTTYKSSWLLLEIVLVSSPPKPLDWTVYVWACMCTHTHMFSVVSSSLRLHGLNIARLLCPWNFSNKNTGVGCHFLLQGVFLTQGLNPCLLRLLHWQGDSLPLMPAGKALKI